MVPTVGALRYESRYFVHTVEGVLLIGLSIFGACTLWRRRGRVLLLKTVQLLIPAGRAYILSFDIVMNGQYKTDEWRNGSDQRNNLAIMIFRDMSDSIENGVRATHLAERPD